MEPVKTYKLAELLSKSFKVKPKKNFSMTQVFKPKKCKKAEIKIYKTKGSCAATAASKSRLIPSISPGGLQPTRTYEKNVTNFQKYRGI